MDVGVGVGVTVVAVARELYGRAPGEFVAARNARAAQARRDGDRDLAARVKALPKPTVAAWAVSLVVREEPGEVDALGELGAELRVAQTTAGAAELRALGSRRRQLTAAVTRTAARLADDRGVPLSAAARDQVSATWQAVVISPAAERAVRTLLLVRGLDPGDLGDVAGALAVPGALSGESATDDGGRVPAPGSGARTAGEPATSGDAAPSDQAAPSDEAAASGAAVGSGAAAARELRRAERDLRAQERVAGQARDDLAEAQEDLARVEAEILHVAARVEELRRDLEQREEALAHLDETRAAAQEDRADAEERVAAADRAVARARAHRAALAD